MGHYGWVFLMKGLLAALAFFALGPILGLLG